MTEDRMIAALLRERDGYVRRGLPERVAQVDEQLALRGYKFPVEEKPAQTPPKARQFPPKRTA